MVNIQEKLIVEQDIEIKHYIEKAIADPDYLIKDSKYLFKKMLECTQNNPNHYGDVLLHTVDALKEARKKYENNTHLLIATLLHDCGKPDVKGTNHKTGYDCFYNHENKSAEKALEFLQKAGYNPSFINHVCSVIEHHDLSMHMTLDESRVNAYCLFVTPENIQKRIDSWKVSKDVFQDIMDLCYVDIIAQSEVAVIGTSKVTREDKLAVLNAIRENSVRLKFY